MNRSSKWLGIVALAAVLSWTIAAEDQGMKIGVVDLQQAMLSTDEGKSALEELQRKAREAKQQVAPLEEQYFEKKNEFDSASKILSDESRFDRSVELAELRNQIESAAREWEGKMKIEENKLFQPIQKKMVEIIEDIGKEEGFTMIIARGAPVIYSREALDITDMVVSRFNKQG